MPLGLVVSIASWRLRKPMPCCSSCSTFLSEVAEGAPEAIEAPDDERVTTADVVEGL